MSVLRTPAHRVTVGRACPTPLNTTTARAALLLAALPQAVPGTTVDRLCGSGADPLAVAARQVRCGEADVVLGGGVGSMTRVPSVLGESAQPVARAPRGEGATLGRGFADPRMQERCGTGAMGQTAEDVAAERR